MLGFIYRFVKAVWICFWAGFFTILLFMPIFLAAVFSRTGSLAFDISRLWTWLILKAAFVKVKVKGTENLKKGVSYVITPNHQSFFDIPAIITYMGIQFRWIIKRELIYVPLFGFALYVSRNVFIDRKNSQRAIESINKGIERLPPGVSVLFFPEGTRSCDGNLLPFKKGGFTIALQRGLPILPVTVSGSSKVLPKGSMVFSPGDIDVVIGEPIETTGFERENIGGLIEKTRREIEKNMVKPRLAGPEGNGNGEAP